MIKFSYKSVHEQSPKHGSGSIIGFDLLLLMRFSALFLIPPPMISVVSV